MSSIAPNEEKQVEETGAVITAEEKPPAGKLKVDLHCHTEISPDCSTSLRLIPDRCISQEIAYQAITDHNEIQGAVELKKIVEDTVEPGKLDIIIGEEISTVEGEIIGLYLNERIPAGMTPEDTVQAIREQEGLVLLPHGFDPLKRWRLHPPALQRITDEIDIVETFNARISNLKWNRAAVAWAEEMGVRMSAGSDAHRLIDIGSAWAEIPDRTIGGPADLLAALSGAVPVGKWIHPAVAYLLKLWDRRVANRFRSRHFPKV